MRVIHLLTHTYFFASCLHLLYFHAALSCTSPTEGIHRRLTSRSVNLWDESKKERTAFAEQGVNTSQMHRSCMALWEVRCWLWVSAVGGNQRLFSLLRKAKTANSHLTIQISWRIIQTSSCCRGYRTQPALSQRLTFDLFHGIQPLLCTHVWTLRRTKELLCRTKSNQWSSWLSALIKGPSAEFTEGGKQ